MMDRERDRQREVRKRNLKLKRLGCLILVTIEGLWTLLFVLIIDE